ncbi:hypothetical protein P3X46_010884 [Hevea brasiliensis]|uniref:Uncharacterized protein n=1 Tax=Hevea brasiliensis TaxID=3981 RepID=A0ABQ9MI73_HEVBR|nr:uncharacterized protein LOC110659195 [Hevea brasiliensis]KAJ9179060.1 hypothetical protein P3X46_010884 [Hevea brasiliensis]
MEASFQESRRLREREEAMMKNNSSFLSQYHNSKPFEAKEEAPSFNKEDRAVVRPLVTENNKPAQKLESKPSMDINESAEAFIKNFRKQLLIQRLESIENYEKMLERGL